MGGADGGRSVNDTGYAPSAWNALVVAQCRDGARPPIFFRNKALLPLPLTLPRKRLKVVDCRRILY